MSQSCSVEPDKKKNTPDFNKKLEEPEENTFISAKEKDLQT
jgi:hypothetical protein